MTKFADWISSKTGYSATFYFCSLNQDDKEAIVRGAKSRFDVSHAMTGRELCTILGIDYDVLRKKKTKPAIRESGILPIRTAENFRNSPVYPKTTQ